MVSHGILPILPLISLQTLTKMKHQLRVSAISEYFCIMPCNTEFEYRDCHRKSRNCHGNVMQKCFLQSLRELWCSLSKSGPTRIHETRDPSISFHRVSVPIDRVQKLSLLELINNQCQIDRYLIDSY